MENYISFGVIAAVCLALGIGGGIHAEKDPFLSTFCFVALGVFIVYVKVTSMYILKPSQMLASFCFGDYLHTFITKSFGEARTVGGRLMSLFSCVRRGFLKLSVVFLLYPIFRGRIVPTTILKLRVHLTDTFSVNDVPMYIDTTLLISFTPEVQLLFLKLLDSSAADEDLTRECDIQDNLYRTVKASAAGPGEEPERPAPEPVDEAYLEKHIYKGTRLEEILLRKAESAILETARMVAATMAETEIRGNLRGFERKVLRSLSRRESIFSELHLLDRENLDRANPRQPDRFYGDSAASIDFNAELATPPKSVVDAMARRRVAELDAQSAKLAGRGEKDRLIEVGKAINKPGGSEAFRGSVIQKLDSVEYVGVDGADALVGQLFRKKGEAGKDESKT
ncbi:MAG: hypothetical protein HYZ63_03875 [Candidatus Andersenbacteria bacterium]|nr:hypothetical protein [Candidatus Andersenbacteria bacterium]